MGSAVVTFTRPYLTVRRDTLRSRRLSFFGHFSRAGRIITGLSRLAFWDLLETGNGGLAGPDNPGLEPSKRPSTTEPWFGDGKVACTGAVGMAATRDNGHSDDKLLDDDDVNDDIGLCPIHVQPVLEGVG